MLRGLDERLRRETGLHVMVADDPLTSVVRGAGRMLADFELLKRVARSLVDRDTSLSAVGCRLSRGRAVPAIGGRSGSD